MSNKSIVTGISRLFLILLLALPVLPAQKPKFKKGQLFYVVAIRDSRLFTMCPPATGLTGKEKTKHEESPVIVNLLPYDMEDVEVNTYKSIPSPSNTPNPMLNENPPYENSVEHDYQRGEARAGFPGEYSSDTPELPGNPVLLVHSGVILPAPVSGSSGRAASEPGKPDRIELDRVTPDADLKRDIEKEFQNQQQYQLTDSLEKADFVFLAEGTTIPLEIWTNQGPPAYPPRSLGYTYSRGDRKPNFLNAVLGLIVPAQAYRQNGGNPAALLEAKVWEGSSIWEYTMKSLPAGGQIKLETYVKNLIPASPAALVRQFLGKEKTPSNHLPLCTASIEARGMQGVEQSLGIQQGSRTPEVVTSLVSVPAVITDTDGKYVSDLKPADFHVFDNNLEQKIEKVILPTDPIDTVLMLDTSTSTRSAFEEMQRWALAFVDALWDGD